MKKEKSYSVICQILIFLLIVCAVYANSTPLAIIAGAYIISYQIEQKELVAKTNVHADTVIVHSSGVDK